MQPLAPKTIRILGIVLAAIGGLLCLGNVISALVIGVFDFPGKIFRSIPNNQVPTDVFALMRASVPLAVATALLGALLCVGALYLRLLRRWALQLVSAVLLLMIAGLWATPFLLRPYTERMLHVMQQSGMPPALHLDSLVLAGQFFNAFFYSLPLGTLLVLLNRKSTRVQFH